MNFNLPRYRTVDMSGHQMDKPEKPRIKNVYKSQYNRRVTRSKILAEDDDSDDLDYRITTLGEQLVEQLLQTRPGTCDAVLAAIRLRKWSRGEINE